MSTDQPTKKSPARKWVAACLWAAMVAWWAWLAWFLWKAPPATPAAEKRSPPAATATAGVPVHVAATNLAQVPPQPEAKPQAPPVAETSAPPAVVAGQERPTNVKAAVADLLIREDYAKAAALLDAEIAKNDAQAAAELAAAKTFVTDLSQLNALIAAAFKSKIGQRVAVEIDNKRHTMVVRGVDGLEVKGELLVKGGDAERAEPVAFSVDTLDPIERSRWLGRADTPAKSAMKFILHLKGGDYASASEFAAQAGPLAEAFTARAKAPPAGLRSP
jgi:hypothetical protein